MNLLAVGTGVLASADKVVGTDQVTLFLTDADGDYPDPSAQVNIELKAASGQYMRQAKSLSWAQPTLVLDVSPGTTFRVKRQNGTCGVDAQGVT